MPEAVVEAPLFGIGEHRVGLGRLFELFLRRFVTRIAVGVVLHRQLAVGALQLHLGHAAGHAEDFVVVALAHAFATFTIAGRSSRSPIRYPRRISPITSPSRWSGLTSCITA